MFKITFLYVTKDRGKSDEENIQHQNCFPTSESWMTLQVENRANDDRDILKFEIMNFSQNIKILLLPKVIELQ